MREPVDIPSSAARFVGENIDLPSSSANTPPKGMTLSDCEYLGKLERDPDGAVRIRRPHIPPAPVRTKRLIQIPVSVARQIARGNAYVTTVIGDSMQPTILDNDLVVVSTSRSPRHRDIVVIRANGPHPVYGPIDGYVWRYYARTSDLGKDNPHYCDRQPVMREEIVGVVTRILPRAYRDEQENYLRIQQHRALSKACNLTDPPDLGFYRERDLSELRAVFQIPAAELVDGRLPWGLFRATAITNQPHVGITTQDVLTVEPTIESCTGQLVVKRNGRWRFTWRQVAYLAFRRWSLAEIHDALGCDAASVLPPLLALQPMTVRLPAYLVRAIEHEAANDKTTVDDWLHHELVDFAGTVVERIERVVPGFRRAYLLPGQEQA